MKHQYYRALARVQYAMEIYTGQYITRVNMLAQIRALIRSWKHNTLLTLKQNGDYAYTVFDTFDGGLAVVLFICKRDLSDLRNEELKMELSQCVPVGFAAFKPWLWTVKEVQKLLQCGFIFVDQQHRGQGFAPGLISLGWKYSKHGITSSDDMDTMSIATFTRMAKRYPQIKLLRSSGKNKGIVDADFSGVMPIVDGIPIDERKKEDFLFVWKK